MIRVEISGMEEAQRLEAGKANENMWGSLLTWAFPLVSFSAQRSEWLNYAAELHPAQHGETHCNHCNIMLFCPERSTFLHVIHITTYSYHHCFVDVAPHRRRCFTTLSVDKTARYTKRVDEPQCNPKTRSRRNFKAPRVV